MALLIGTDEAGYGPNLGPLLISATVWQVPDETANADLYRVLRRTVRADTSSNSQIAIADSKALYKPGAGLTHLEKGVLAAAAVFPTWPKSWQGAWQFFAPRDATYLDEIPWYADYDMPLPMETTSSDIEECGRRLADGWRAAGVSLVGIQSSAVFASRFNKLLDQHDSKGAALSHETLELVKRCLADSDDKQIIVQCDKHGGRNRYAALLQTVFPDHWIEVVRESRESSVYRWGPSSRRVEIRFAAKGESFLPAALASMTSKYLRELAMLAFNAFWQQHLPKLKPTAGYPVDARRFKQEIATVQQALGISDRILWRQK